MQHHLLADFRDLKYSLSTIMSENVTYMCIYVIICMHIAILSIIHTKIICLYAYIKVQTYIKQNTTMAGARKNHMFSATSVGSASHWHPNRRASCAAPDAKRPLWASAEALWLIVPLENGRSSWQRRDVIQKPKSPAKKGLRLCDFNFYSYICYHISHMWHYLRSTTAAGEGLLPILIDFA